MIFDLQIKLDADGVMRSNLNPNAILALEVKDAINDFVDAVNNREPEIALDAREVIGFLGRI